MTYFGKDLRDTVNRLEQIEKGSSSKSTQKKVIKESRERQKQISVKIPTYVNSAIQNYFDIFKFSNDRNLPLVENDQGKKYQNVVARLAVAIVKGSDMSRYLKEKVDAKTVKNVCIKIMESMISANPILEKEKWVPPWIKNKDKDKDEDKKSDKDEDDDDDDDDDKKDKKDKKKDKDEDEDED